MDESRSTPAQLVAARDFRQIRLAGRMTLYLRSELAGMAQELVRRLIALDRHGGGAGNRGGGYRLDSEAGALFVRKCHRGGLVAFAVRDLYFGRTPRPLRELADTLIAVERGVALAEPVGVVIQWAAPLIYRGFFLTRYLQGRTLWDLLSAETDGTRRIAALSAARAAIARMHRSGVEHADLNLHNIFVTGDPAAPSVVLLDLDKARLHSGPLAPARCAVHLARLARSARKLERRGLALNNGEQAALGLTG